MAEPDDETTGQAGGDNGPERTALKAPLPEVLSGSDTLFDGALHVGVAIEVSASGSKSFVMIPDATRITQGQPIYITRKVAIEGKNISEFLASKNVTLPEALQRLLKTTSIACDAFYLAPKKRPATTEEKANPKLAPSITNGNIDESVMLMMFELNFEKGLIGALAGDEALGKLFDVNGAKVRVLRCPASSRAVLEGYARQLTEE